MARRSSTRRSPCRVDFAVDGDDLMAFRPPARGRPISAGRIPRACGPALFLQAAAAVSFFRRIRFRHRSGGPPRGPVGGARRTPAPHAPRVAGRCTAGRPGLPAGRGARGAGAASLPPRPPSPDSGSRAAARAARRRGLRRPPARLLARHRLPHLSRAGSRGVRRRATAHPRIRRRLPSRRRPAGARRESARASGGPHGPHLLARVADEAGIGAGAGRAAPRGSPGRAVAARTARA